MAFIIIGGIVAAWAGTSVAVAFVVGRMSRRADIRAGLTPDQFVGAPLAHSGTIGTLTR